MLSVNVVVSLGFICPVFCCRVVLRISRVKSRNLTFTNLTFDIWQFDIYKFMLNLYNPAVLHWLVIRICFCFCFVCIFLLLWWIKIINVISAKPVQNSERCKAREKEIHQNLKRLDKMMQTKTTWPCSAFGYQQKTQLSCGEMADQIREGNRDRRLTQCYMDP